MFGGLHPPYEQATDTDIGSLVGFTHPTEYVQTSRRVIVFCTQASNSLKPPLDRPRSAVEPIVDLAVGVAF